MLTDAHCHPFNLQEYFQAAAAEEERRQLGIICVSSSTTPEEFKYCEKLSQKAGIDAAVRLLPGFAVHPQLLTTGKEQLARHDALVFLDTAAAKGRLAAVGETGFDLFNAAFRETEKIQEELFAVHLETALRYELPLIMHTRRAMHKVFANALLLKKCRAVIFHSWPGTAGEGEALLRKGINVYFSFGAAIVNNHREAKHCCSVFPSERLLTETDAPFQPLRGCLFSSYKDIKHILETMAVLRGESEMERIVEENFCTAFLS
jgi:TatD DNase family protein